MLYLYLSISLLNSINYNDIHTLVNNYKLENNNTEVITEKGGVLHVHIHGVVHYTV